jgi:hypothetical protein
MTSLAGVLNRANASRDETGTSTMTLVALRDSSALRHEAVRAPPGVLT